MYLHSMACWPTTVPSVLADYERVCLGERRLAEILVGYLDIEDTSIPEVAEEEDIELATTAKKTDSDDDEKEEEVAEGATDEEDEVEAGPDPEIARQRFTELSRTISSNPRYCYNMAVSALKVKKQLLP
jgi:RNA polymerase primary sigma factor